MGVLQDINDSLFTPPTMYEIATFFITSIIFVFVAILYHYSNIQQQVRLTSRCYKEKQKATMGGKYMVTANDKDRNPLYTVAYDMGAKQYAVNCACTPGTVTVQMPAFPVYDMKINQTRYMDRQLCQCASDVDTSKIFYTGYPDLIRYMQDDNQTQFFAAKL